MKVQSVTQLPFGYDDRTVMTLTLNNDILIAHPVMPPMIYDEQVMRWTHISAEQPQPN